MSNINIRNGILLSSENNYLIYEMYIPNNTLDNNKYFMCIPNSNYNEYQIVLDLPEVNLAGLNKENIVNEIEKTADKAFSKYKNIIYVLPNIDIEEKNDALNDNDDHLFTKFHNKIMSFVSNAYWSIKDKNTQTNVPETTNIIIETELDKRYIDWLQLYRSNDNFIAINLADNMIIDDTGGTALSGPSNNDISNELSKPLTKKLVPPKKSSSGFSNIIYLSILLMVVIIGTVMGYLIIK